MTRPISPHRSYVFVAGVVLLIILVGLSFQLRQPAATPQGSIERAWELAQQSGTYRYQAQIEQTTYPAPSLANAGRGPRTDTVLLEGAVDQPNQQLELTLAPNGDPLQAIELRVAAGRAEGRVAGGDWRPIERPTDLFAPGGDPLGFLAGMVNPQLAGSEPSPVAAIPGAADLRMLTRYTFTLDGPALAAALRPRLEEQLRRSGQLPHGLAVDAAALYAQLEGSGELWVDADGLPARLLLRLDLPAQHSDQVHAVITTDYRSFDRAQLALASTSFFDNPAGWLSYRLSAYAAALRHIAFGAALVITAVGALLGILRSWRSPAGQRRVYVVLVSTVLGGMLLTPQLRANTVAAAVEQQHSAQAAQEQQQAHAEVRAAAEQLQPEWNPHAQPQAAPVGPPASSSIQATTVLTSTDSDGDGLADSDEERWGSCPSGASSSDFCAGVSNSTDSDGDGLSDGTEVNGLGTQPNAWDSDGDSITDTLEIQGFDYRGQRWYLNPSEPDSNADGLIDSLECPAWLPGSPHFSPGAACPDADNDGAPNLFDADNDGDRVVDSIDLSPGAGGSSFGPDAPLSFAIPGLTEDRPVSVDFQLRPTNSDHINYVNAVLDWPSGDTAGQIARGNDSTFADTANLDIRSNGPNAANGDVRIVPMLEITMPYTTGHYASLPVTGPYSQTTRSLSTDLATWLDTSMLTPYGIAVQQIDASSGDLVAYVPLTVVADETGGGRVALSGRMLYRPTQASWGSAQQVRLVWLVQMITDGCADASADPATCARADELSVINVYQDDWTLTGMAVTEERGMDVAIVYENPATDDDLRQDDQLWMASWSLGGTFLRGRDCDSVVNGTCQSNGERDVTIDTLKSSIDGWAGGAANHDLAVSTFAYPSQDYAMAVAMTETKALLNSAFASHTAIAPTFLFAREIALRSLSMEQASANGPQLTFAMSAANAPLEVSASLNWASYRYVDGGWQNYDAEEYLDGLAARLGGDPFFQPADASQSSQDEVEGKQIWAQSYYAALYSGLSATIEQGAELTWRTSDPVPETSYELDWPPSTSYGLTYIAFAYLEIIEAAAPQLGGGTSFWLQIKQAYTQGMSQFTFQFGKTFKNHPFSTAVGLLAGVTTVAAATGAIIFVVGFATGDSALIRTGVYILSAVTAVTMTLYIANMVYTAYRLYQATTAISILTLAARLSSFKAVGTVGLVLGLAITWGILFYQWASGQISPGTIAFDMAIAQAVAQTIVLLIFFLLDFTLIGTLIVLLIYLVDAILTLFGKTGVQQWVTEKLAEAMYDVDFMISNLDSSDRLTYSLNSIALRDPEAGFIVSNAITVNMQVTTTLEYDNDFDVGDAKRSTFRYGLQGTQEELDVDLGQNAMDEAWQAIGNRRIRTSTPVAHQVGLQGDGTGVNRTLGDRLYLTEAFNAPYEGCWQFFGLEHSCSWENFTGSNHLDVGHYLTFDVLPNTLTEFFAMDWNTNADLPFPAQTDQDGDGLLSLAQGGSDPDDTSFDADRDGLSDGYEQAHGLDATRADTDRDGLTDQEDAALGTNPRKADTDGDGLTDYLEARQGWLIGYGGDGITRVWSDPTIADADADALNDLQEYVFEFNPWVATDPSLIDDLVQFDGISISEQAAPALLARFEEARGATSFGDSSGSGQILSCAEATCPTAGGTGRYGAALALDGSSFVAVEGGVAELGKGSFTIAAWVKTTGVGQGIVTKRDGDTSWEQGEKSFYLNGSGRPTFVGYGNAFIHSTQAVNDGAWHHVAVTWNYAGGTSGTGAIYIDGVAHTDGAATNYAANNVDKPGDTLQIGRTNQNISEARSNFTGGLDEVAIYDRALTSGEVAALMEGRYDTNDLLLTTGADLTYQATISNTLVTRGANGHMTAAGVAVDPAIAEPQIALRFEDEDRIMMFSNSTGESTAGLCYTARCPSSVRVSGTNRAVQFDSPQDELRIGRLLNTTWAEDYIASTINIAIKVDSLPASGKLAHILSTDDVRLGALDIYLDSAGKLYFAVQGSVSKEYWYYTNGTLNSIQPWVGYGYHVSNTTFSGANLGVWKNISFTAEFYIPNGNPTARSALTINGTIDSRVDFSTWPGLIIGPGRLGNNAEATSPLQASLDSFSAGDLRLDFTEDPTFDATSFYSGNNGFTSCTDDSLCPDYLLSGQRNEAVSFDGIDDRLPMTENRSYGFNNTANLVFWVKLNALPADKYYLLDTTCTIGEKCPDIYINAAGKIVLTFSSMGTIFESNTNLTSSDFGTWVKIEIQIQLAAEHAPTNYIQFRVRNVLDKNTSTGGTLAPLRVAPSVVGNSADGAYPLQGGLDEISLGGGYDINFDAPPFFLHQLNRVTDARVGGCEYTVICPAATEGRFGTALAFDGHNDQLKLVDKGYLSSYTISAWVRPAEVEAQSIIVSTDQQGSLLSWSNQLRINAQGRFQHYAWDGAQRTVTGTTVVQPGTWYHVAGVATSDGMLRLYVNGVEEGTPVALGNLPSKLISTMVGTPSGGGFGAFSGALDELQIIPAATGAAGVRALMSGTYPAIDIASDFSTFGLEPRSAITISDTAQVNADITSGQHRFDQQVEAAIELEHDLSYAIVDDYAADLTVFTPFEDVPGSTSFQNLGDVTWWTDLGRDFTTMACSGSSCPVAGLRGQTGRALHFDGIDDSMGWPTECCGIEAATIAVWVKADRGTILDTRTFNGSTFRSGIQLDFNRLQVVIDNYVIGGGSFGYHTTYMDLPENEWTFVAVTVDLTNWQAKLYINGALVTTMPLAHPHSRSDIFSQFPVLGSNSDQGSDFLHGYLDELRIYETVLSESEIAALYTKSAAVMNFEFDEDSSASVFSDSSPNSYDGQPGATACAPVTLSSLSPSVLAVNPSTLYVARDNDRLATVAGSTIGGTYPLTASAQLCAGDTLSIGRVNDNGTLAAVASQPIAITASGAGSAVFANGANSITLRWNVGDGRSYRYNPTPGTDGKIGNTALFDGKGSIMVADATAVDALTSTLTIVGWIKPGDTKSGATQILLSHGLDLTTNGIGFGTIGPVVWFRPLGATLYTSTAVLDSSVWQQVAVVYDRPNNSLEFYINGVLNKQYSGAIASIIRNSDDPLYIGARAGASGAIQNFYTGQLDELGVYSRALSPSELYALYLRDLRWYRDRTSALLTVDTDDPTIALLSSGAYRANAPTQLALAAADPTTAVRLVDVGVKGPAAGGFSWSSAPVCAEAADSSAAWCPSFDPTAHGGEGAYQLQFRAVDAVGHQTTGAPATIYVDGTAPSAASAASQTRRALTPGGRLTWTVALSGTVSDPALAGGSAGSGLVTETVRVQLLDSTGEVVDDGAQAATVSGGGWSISYRLSGARPSGTYTVQVLAEDAVGNAATSSVGTIILDGRGPSVDTRASTLPTDLLTSSVTLSGTLSEQAEWGGEIAKFHFEEPSGSTSFADASGSGNHASCATCPAPASGGPFGGALSFSGQQFLTTAMTNAIELGKGSFTIAAWIKTSGVSQGILTKSDGDGSWERGEKTFYINSAGRPAFVGWGNAFITSTLAVNDGAWHHVAVTWSYAGGTSGTGSIFVDGADVTNRAVTSYNANNADNPGDTIAIGRSNQNPNEAAGNFSGQLDQVALYDRALTPGEIYALAQTDGSGLSAAQVWIEEYHVDGPADSPSWQPATLAAPGASLSGWSYALPSAAEGLYRIHVRGVDAEANLSPEQIVWSGSIDTRAPRLTLTATRLGDGPAAETELTYAIDDLFLDAETITALCPAGALTFGYDESGRLSSAEATCRIPGHQTSVSLTACDYAGHCSTETITPAAGDARNIVILSPADGGSSLASVPISITGGASAPDGIASIAVSANGAPIGSIAGNGAATLNWSLGWTPAAGTYTITARLTDQLGATREDTIVLTIADAFGLSVSTAGTGTGSVTSAPAGIACGTTCSALFTASTAVTLTATPDADSIFEGWAGACGGTSPTCAITLDQARSVTATFTRDSTPVFLPLLRR